MPFLCEPQPAVSAMILPAAPDVRALRKSERLIDVIGQAVFNDSLRKKKPSTFITEGVKRFHELCCRNVAIFFLNKAGLHEIRQRVGFLKQIVDFILLSFGLFDLSIVFSQ